MEFNFDRILLPLATSMVGLIPVLINLAAGWADRKSKVARMNAFLQQTNQRMGFLQSWFNLQKEVSSPEQLSQIKGALSEELQEIYESLAEALLDSYNETSHRRELMSRYKKTTPLRRFLLLYSPYNTRGWLFHTLYYMCILPLVVGGRLCRFPIRANKNLDGKYPSRVYVRGYRLACPAVHLPLVWTHGC